MICTCIYIHTSLSLYLPLPLSLSLLKSRIIVFSGIGWGNVSSLLRSAAQKLTRSGLGRGSERARTSAMVQVQFNYKALKKSQPGYSWLLHT